MSEPVYTITEVNIDLTKDEMAAFLAAQRTVPKAVSDREYLDANTVNVLFTAAAYRVSVESKLYLDREISSAFDHIQTIVPTFTAAICEQWLTFILKLPVPLICDMNHYAALIELAKAR